MPTTLKNGMFVTPPNNGAQGNFTKDKKYQVSSVSKSDLEFGNNLYITDDNGIACYCLLNYCFHINNLNWKIVEL